MPIGVNRTARPGVVDEQAAVRRPRVEALAVGRREGRHLGAESGHILPVDVPLTRPIGREQQAATVGGPRRGHVVVTVERHADRRLAVEVVDPDVARSRQWVPAATANRFPSGDTRAPL